MLSRTSLEQRSLLPVPRVQPPSAFVDVGAHLRATSCVESAVVCRYIRAAGAYAVLVLDLLRLLTLQHPKTVAEQSIHVCEIRPLTPRVLQPRQRTCIWFGQLRTA